MIAFRTQGSELRPVPFGNEVDLPVDHVIAAWSTIAYAAFGMFPAHGSASVMELPGMSSVVTREQIEKATTQRTRR